MQIAGKPVIEAGKMVAVEFADEAAAVVAKAPKHVANAAQKLGQKQYTAQRKLARYRQAHERALKMAKQPNAHAKWAKNAAEYADVVQMLESQDKVIASDAAKLLKPAD